MKFPRSAGILLHPTSLPSRFGIGDLGPEAYRFIEFLSEAGQRIWQVLPLGPTGYGDSPYQSLSAFAGNPMLISPEKLVEHGYLDTSDLEEAELPSTNHVDFGAVGDRKTALLRKAFKRFRPTLDFERFCERNSYWLDEFVHFIALKEANQNRAWTDWTPNAADPQNEDAHRFWQYEFFHQWDELKLHCHERGIKVMGDIPIYVASDSADVWSRRDLFDLDAHGHPRHVAGVPPDYFSDTGQLWGNPVYNWSRLAETGYAWWIERFRAVFQQVDMVRLDHFRGFEAFWQVPAEEKTAVNGKWVKANGEELFETLRKDLGDLPIVAENLGVITPEVESMRERFGFPGMSVLQFAFGSDPQAPTFRPHNYPRKIAAYTGTHDNDTTVGWWHAKAGVTDTRTAEDIEKERDFARAYLGTAASEIQWDFIRALMASVADTAVVPMQDVLGLGNEARMNRPATTSGNWSWRLLPEQIHRSHVVRLKQLAALYDRA